MSALGLRWSSVPRGGNFGGIQIYKISINNKPIINTQWLINPTNYRILRLRFSSSASHCPLLPKNLINLHAILSYFPHLWILLPIFASNLHPNPFSCSSGFFPLPLPKIFRLTLIRMEMVTRLAHIYRFAPWSSLMHFRLCRLACPHTSKHIAKAGLIIDLICFRIPWNLCFLVTGSCFHFFVNPENQNLNISHFSALKVCSSHITSIFAWLALKALFPWAICVCPLVKP